MTCTVHTIRRLIGSGFACASLTLACAPQRDAPPAAPALGPPLLNGASQVVYVPVYSSIFDKDRSKMLDLTITLSVRNADPRRPITLRRVRYFDTTGKLLHTYLDAPGALGPLAAAEYVVREDDTRGGVGASFLVEWSAEGAINPPVVEAVMIGTAMQQGISFVTVGRPLLPGSDEAPDSR